MSFWVFKTEPDKYSFEDLVKDKKTPWNGIRNFQARNYLQKVQKKDQVLIYHTSGVCKIVGLARVFSDPYPENDPNRPGNWIQVDIEPIRKLQQEISLQEIKKIFLFKDSPLVRQPRLSIIPLSAEQFECLLQLSQQ